MRSSLLVALVVSGCAGSSPELAARSADVTRTTAAAEPTGAGTLAAPPSASTPEPAAAVPDNTSLAWAEATKSHWPLTRGSDTREDALLTACGEPDGAIDRVAHEIADERARGLGAPDADAVDVLLRVVGEPHPRARVVSAMGRAPLDDAAIGKRLASMKKPLTRCGVALARTPHGGELVVAIAVEAYAELAPLPMRARTGEWLTFDATFAVPAEGAKLVVLGPRGAPRTVPTSLDPRTGRARARFALDRPGAFRVQLVADVGAGPRPILEARVFADESPPDTLEIDHAPGEDAATTNDASALARMVDALRAAENVPKVARDASLDKLAQAHAERMRDDAKLAHDVGEGDLRERFEAQGLFAKVVGENVAHAPNVTLAHRTLHASPSHRINLLRADYTHLGVGVAVAADGTVYVCEVFAARAAVR